MQARRWRPSLAMGILSLALLGCLSASVVRAGEESAEESADSISVPQALELANDSRPAIVRVQWRRSKAPRDAIERHAVVVDPNGWLLMAGPRPSPDGTLAARLENGRSMRAEVWASDPLTCLTVLRVPATRLPPLAFHQARREPTATLLPPRPAAGLPFVMVTAEGDVAMGQLRGSHRMRIIEDPVRGRTVEVTCLDKAAVSVLAPDLGAPWLDAQGRIVGLLVGADVGPPIEGASGRLRPVVTAAYAVPSEVIRVVWPLLKAQRQVARVALGARVKHLSPATRHHVCPDCEGFEVLAIQPGGSAERARLLPHDIIRTVNGTRIAPRADLWDVLLPHRPGDQVRLGLLRRGEPLDVDVVLGRAP